MQATNILIIQNKRIGDALLTSVIANNIKTIFPESKVTFFAYDYTSGVLENNPNIDTLWLVNEKDLKNQAYFFKVLKQVRKNKYDLIFDPYAKFQSKMMCLFSGSPMRLGFKRKNKKLKLPFYTKAIDFKEKATLPCGRAIEDRVNMVEAAFSLPSPNYHPKIFLSEEELKRNFNGIGKKPVVMFGVLGSVPKKSMPKEYIAQLVDYVASNYDVTVLFNYAPHQKADALAIYDLCKNQDSINLDIYAQSIRDFAVLMNQCDMLIANEGGSVHITKALNKPTFTIYSPYIDKDAWNSFEDGTMHQSVHLKEEKPELYDSFDRETTKKIEKNPEFLYQQLTPEIILGKLESYLKNHLESQKIN